MSKGLPTDKLEDLIHDVNSGCGSLKEAASMLRKASPAEAQEFLTLMEEQALNLAKTLAAARQRHLGI